MVFGPQKPYGTEGLRRLGFKQLV